MARKLIYILLVFLTFSSNALTQNSSEDPYKFLASFDMRNSIVIGHAVKFNGLKFGVGNSKHRFGIGFYGLRNPVTTFNSKINEVDATDTNRYNFGFVSFYFEKIFYQSKRWEITSPLHLNIGSLKAEYLSNEGIYKEFLDKGILSTTIAVKSHFKVFRWVGIQGGVGYNLILNGDKRTQKALNAPFYSFGVKIFLGEIWKLTTNKTYRKSEWTE